MGTLSYMDANGVWHTTEDAPSGGVQLTDGSVITPYIADGAVTNQKITSMATSKLTGTLSGTIIDNGTITGAKLANGTIGYIYLDGGIKQDITNAQSTADGAHSLAMGKNTIYYSATEPVAPTDGFVDGDLWINTAEGNKLYAYDSTATPKWQVAQDDAIASAQSDADQAISQISLAANGKNIVYRQDAMPTGGAYSVGDTWFDTNDANKLYLWNGSIWYANAITNPDGSIPIANTINKVYFQGTLPTGGVYLLGDKWFNTSDADKQYTYTRTGWQTTEDVWSVSNAAAIALQAANGKNKVVYSTLNPTGTGFVVGDMWYKTGTNATTGDTGIVTLYAYTAGGWVAQTITDSVLGNITANRITVGTLNGNLIAANTLTGDRITTGTLDAGKIVANSITASSGIFATGAIQTAWIGDAQITNAKIGAVDASKITTGHLSADRIDAGTITAAKIASNTLTVDKVASTFGSNLDISSNAGVTVLARKDSLISYLNVSPEVITINGSKIDINGALTLSNWANAGDTTKIDGGKIYANSISVNAVSSTFGTDLNISSNTAITSRVTTTAMNTAIQNLVASVDVEFYLSTSSTVATGGSWVTTAPAWVNGKFMWTRTKTTYQNASIAYEPSIDGTCIAGATGATGTAGADGKGITSIVEEYYQSTSASTQTGGAWSTSAPSWINGQYIWTRTKITYTDASVVTTNPINATGAIGSTGATGTSALTTLVTNESCSLPADSAGTVSSYTGSGTEVHLYEGATELTYDAVGTSNGTWKVVATGSGVTPSSPTDSGLFATYGAHSAMTADLATVTLAITGKRQDGTAISLSRVQTLTKSKAGVTPIRTAVLEMFQWATSIPTVFPSGSSTYTWATGAFTAPATPNSWTLLPGTGTAGQTLWACRQVYTDQVTAATSAVTWSTSTAYAEGAAGTNGAQGNPGTAGTNAIMGTLNNESATVPASSNGTVSSFATAVTTMSVYNGATDDSANWSFSQVASGCTATASGSPANRTTTLTAMSTDTATVTFTATRSGYANIVKVFNITKSKAGADGATGGAGSNATSYWLVSDALVVQKSIASVYTPASINVTAKSQTGIGVPGNYSGRFIIADSPDGTTYTDRYTSAADEATKSYTPSAGIKTLRIRMYLAGGTTTLLDEIIVPIVSDGATGSAGSNGTNGSRTAIITMYKWSVTSPTTYLTGSSTYTWATGQFTNPATLNGWTRTPPAAVVGQTLWGISQVYSDTATAATSTITWASTTPFSLGYAGSNGTNGTAGADAKYVVVTGDQAFKFLTGQAVPTATSITLTATLYGGLTTYDWEYWNGAAWTNLGGTQTNQTYVVQYNAAEWGANTTLRIRCLSGTYSDEITLVKLYDGAAGSNGTNGVNAVSGYLTNETMAVTSASDGTGYVLTSAGGTFNIFNGTTNVTTSSTFTVVGGTTTKTQNGLTMTIGAVTGVYTLSGASWTTDTEIFTLQGVYSGTTIQKNYVITKAKAGAAGSNGSNGSNAKSADIISSSQIFKSTDGGINFTPNTITLTPVLQVAAFSKWQYSTDGGSTWVDAVTATHGITMSANVLTLSKTSDLFTSAITSVGFKLITDDVNIYDTITIIKLYDVVDIQIGGKNLLVNSGYTNDVSGTLNRGALQTISRDMANGYNDNASLAIVSSGASVYGTSDVWQYLNGIAVVNNNVMLSFWVKGSIATTGWARLYGSTSSAGSRAFNITTGWTKVTLDMGAITAVGVLDGNAVIYGFDAAGTYYVNSMKLEYGNKATDWTPAPQDIDTQLFGLQGRLSGVESTLTGTSIIDSVRQTQWYQDDLATKASADALTALNGTLSTNYSTTQQTANAISFEVGSINQRLDTALQPTIDNIAAFMSFTPAGLLIGNSRSGLTVNIDNDSVDFMQGDVKVATMESFNLSITNAVITGAITFGNHVVSKEGGITVFRTAA